VSGALLFSIISDVLLIVLVRRSVRTLSQETSPQRIIGALFAQATAIALTFTIPYEAAIRFGPSFAKSAFAGNLFFVAVFNLPTAFASLAFSVALVAVLLHRIIWPFLSRSTYSLTRKDVLDKRKTIRTVGFICIGYALAGHASLAAFLEKLLK
jgi:hypothetical protein